MTEYHDSSFNSIKTVITFLVGSDELVLSWAARIPVAPCESDASAGGGLQREVLQDQADLPPPRILYRVI